MSFEVVQARRVFAEHGIQAARGPFPQSLTNGIYPHHSRTDHSKASQRCRATMFSQFVLTILLLVLATPAYATLVDAWRASELNLLDDGDSVGSWSSQSNRLATAAVGEEPVFRKKATPTDDAAVHFDLNRLTVPSSPVAGLSAFSLAVVFRVDQNGVDDGSGWSTKSCIVDANQSGVTNDWGFAVRDTGYVCFGTGAPGGGDSTVYLDNQPTYPSVVDGKYHVVVCTWGGGSQTMYMDGLPSKSQSGVSTAARGDAGISLGGIHTGETNRRFVGDLVEVQFYDTALAATEATALISQLTTQYISRPLPVIQSFAASTNQILQGESVTLSWAVSNATLITMDNGVGVLNAATGSVQVLSTTTTTYSLSASNAAGVRTAQVTVNVDPGVPVAEAQTISVARDTARAITLAGHDPQGSPLTFAIVQSPAKGTLSGTPPNVMYTPATGYTGADYFTFKVNDGTHDSLAATVEIFVDDAARPPHGLFLNTATVDATAVEGMVLGVLRAVDVNRYDTCAFTLIDGPGATNNGMFSIRENRLLAGSGFPTTAGADLWIRIRATDATGLYIEKAFALKTKLPERHVVINEIHYNPAQNTVREEFIELYNPDQAPLDLSLWRLRGGVDYIIPSGTTIAAGGYLVVASQPDTIQKQYHVTALGPWAGNLSSDGERVTLRNALDEVVDEVDYKSEFPWPIAANGSGASMELINPALDNNLGSSWASPLAPALPSPGRVNQIFATNAAPNIRQVNHSPKQPASTNQVVVTVKVTDPQGVVAVDLSYQVVAPGQFVPSYLPFTVTELNAKPLAVPPSNPAFEAAANWVTVPMHDDGLNGDAEAGDDVYTVVLPMQANRTLVRYRITCTDGLGASRRAPFEDDASLNFAYFVYDGLPDYGGVAATNLAALPVYFLITRSADLDACTAYTGSQIPQEVNSLANEARFVFNWPGAIVYDGEVYDHIKYRLRGANGRYQNGKRNFRFRFNDGHYFAAKDEFGHPYPRKWSSLSTAKGQSNRETLTFSLNEYLNYILLNKVGVPSPNSHFFHWRVVRGAQEAPGLYTGDFYGTSWAQEEYDAAFLESHNLAKGNLYKLINARRAWDANQDMVMQQRYQGAFGATNGADAVRIESALINPNTSQTDAWLYANVNYTNWYAYHAILEAVRNYDTWPSANKNAAWYFDTNYTAANGYNGRFWTLPWDWTDTWGPTWNEGHDLAWNGIWGSTASIHANMLRDYRNTMREIRDLLLQPDQMNAMIDAVAARLAPVVAADLTRWAKATPYNSSYSSMGRPGPALTQGLAGYVKDLKTFMFTGGTCSWWAGGETVASGGWITRLDNVAADANIPNQPRIYYVGQSNYPMNSLIFVCMPFGDPQGTATFAGMQWRLAEVQNTNQPAADPRVIPPLEWDAVWTSGILSNWNSRITIPGVYVQTNKMYRVRVRHLDTTGRWSKWSLPVEFTPSAEDVVAAMREGLRFTEIMYNPPAQGIYSGDDLEFLELKNTGNESLDLSGLTFSGITFTFTNGTLLAPGQTFLLGRNAAALQAKYPGLIVNGVYTGKLDNAGETISLNTPTGTTVIEVTYKDSPPWPVTADGMGWSLVLEDPAAGTYRASTRSGGSPGTDDPTNTIPPIVINELLTNTDPPLVDMIELFNPTDASVNVGGWFLTDNADAPMSYRIPPDALIPAHGYMVFDESHFNTGASAFALSSHGGEVYLFSGDATTNLTGYAHGARYGASRNGVSFGRYLNSLGEEDFVAMSSRTFGTNNSRPMVGPVVISEIMFQPQSDGTNGNNEFEFIELQNVSATNVPLFSVEHPTNTWHLGNAVDFAFPANVVLPVEGRVLVVGFDPAANPRVLTNFLTLYGVGTNVPVYGPWSGRLDNAGETIELKCPDQPEWDGSVPYILVEKVKYGSVLPWPDGAAGTGNSLQRAALLAYANDPTNWFSAIPTAGTLSGQTSQDVDGDGMPDRWEMLHGTDPFVNDADVDADHDGLNNLAEWVAGTDPQDPESALKIGAIQRGGESVTLKFIAVANRSYTLLRASSADAAVWLKAADVPAAPTNRLCTLDQAVTDSHAFYRLVTPAIP